MPLFFLLVGIMLVVVGINDKLTQLGALIKDDFKPSDGSAGFHIWIAAIFAVGLVGYYAPAKTFSRTFLGLILVVMVLSNKGFFAKFSQALKG